MQDFCPFHFGALMHPILQSTGKVGSRHQARYELSIPEEGDEDCDVVIHPASVLFKATPSPMFVVFTELFATGRVRSVETVSISVPVAYHLTHSRDT